ncbi:MAG: PGF-CTERM sorting domain-containing protein [Halobacteriales archaeon]|nr:PGF-CTERM sorting domain-containing protein [Halobacteriales archaeon]
MFSVGTAAASSHTGDRTTISTDVEISDSAEEATSTYTAEFTYDSVGDETAQFVSVDFGSDADFSSALNDTNNVAVSAPDGSSLDVAGTLDADGTLVIQLGDGEGISDADEGDTYTVEVQEVVNPDAGDYDLTLGLHDTGDEILDAASAAFAADTATYTVGDGEEATMVTFEDQTSDGDSVVVAESSHAEDYVVVVHADDEGAPGDILGSEGDLDAGVNENVTVSLDETLDAGEHTLHAMLHATSEDGDYGSPLTVDGEVVVESAQVTVEEDMDDDDGMGDGTDDDETDDDGGEGLPGFTAVAAVVALVGAAFMLARRDE